jgi:hypothetical protein
VNDDIRALAGELERDLAPDATAATCTCDERSPPAQREVAHVDLRTIMPC